ncbi:hypothetical protein CANCADRAFT_90936 [Tortispora caseinolytica NRRL Y-17796]|uniref:Uncharacterized protein n=1 Tax=Tortispora caseinolytica NRRL Y-17796 TaxID=767744 RepID=A0A1E4TLS1_9ASCO|nr:hypothetical protein CANCADRAFT_90936 [Tortispora caseinolytica NRRL Y-17796]
MSSLLYLFGLSWRKSNELSKQETCDSRIIEQPVAEEIGVIGETDPVRVTITADEGFDIINLESVVLTSKMATVGAGAGAAAAAVATASSTNYDAECSDIDPIHIHFANKALKDKKRKLDKKNKKRRH